MKHRLTVKIEKRFKRQLSKRFNPRNAQVSKEFGHGEEIKIEIECSLCKEYMNVLKCFNCPFKKFEGKTQRGCLMWVNEIMGMERLIPIQITEKRIYWHGNGNQEAIELLKKLREKAKKYIIWI